MARQFLSRPIAFRVVVRPQSWSPEQDAVLRTVAKTHRAEVSADDHRLEWKHPRASVLDVVRAWDLLQQFGAIEAVILGVEEGHREYVEKKLRQFIPPAVQGDTKLVWEVLESAPQ